MHVPGVVVARFGANGMLVGGAPLGLAQLRGRWPGPWEVQPPRLIQVLANRRGITKRVHDQGSADDRSSIGFRSRASLRNSQHWYDRDYDHPRYFWLKPEQTYEVIPGAWERMQEPRSR